MTMNMQTYEAMALVAVATVGLGAWLKARRLEARLQQVADALLQLIDESEGATNELRRSIAKLEQSNNGASEAPTLRLAKSAPAEAVNNNGADYSTETWSLD